MSPSLVFPWRVRIRELPPYGPSDWKRLQPVLLRRSLALSSATALAAGLALGWFLQHAALVPLKDPIFELDPHDIHPPPAFPGVASEPRTRTGPSEHGMPVPESPDAPSVTDPGPPTAPGPIDSDRLLPIGIGGDGKSASDSVSERPDPKVFVPLDEPPFPVYSPKPDYPALAQQAGMEGVVRLQVLVDRQGNVAEVLNLDSSPMFDDAAEKAIRRWRFRPGILAGRPVAAWVVVPVRFLLH